MLVFLVLAGNSFWHFVHMVLIVHYNCAFVRLCQFLVLAITTGKKKVTIVCLAGCAVVSVFW